MKKIIFFHFLFFILMTQLYGFEKEGKKGVYLNTGYRNNPDAFAGALGIEVFGTDQFAGYAGLIFMNADREDFKLYGLELGVRKYFGSRFSPFVGLGSSFGKEQIEVKIEKTEEGWDIGLGWPENNDPVYYDQEQILRDRGEKETDWIATVYPELGIEYFPKEDWSFTFSNRYQITNGLTDNFWLHYFAVSFYWD